MATGQLSVLPPEIRAIVWKFSLPDDVPEVCILQKPSIFATSFLLTLVVDTAFPALVHVCRETRYFVFNSKISGVQFRYSDFAGCDTPFRPFRNDLDTLLNAHVSGVNHIPTNIDSEVEAMALVHNIDDIDALQEVSELTYIGSSFPNLEHLALRVPTRHILEVFIREVLHHFLPRLKTVTFVTVQTTGPVQATVPIRFTEPGQVTAAVQITGTANQVLLPDFQPPKGRCKLHRFSTNEMEHLAIKTRQDVQNMDDMIANVLLGSMSLGEYVDATQARYNSSLAEKIEVEKELVSTNGEKIFPAILERALDFQAQTLVEYKNKSWNRAIAGTHPSEQIDTQLSCLSFNLLIHPEASVCRDGACIPKREISALYATEGHARLKRRRQEFVELGLIQGDAQRDDDEDDEDDNVDDEDDNGNGQGRVQR